MRECVDEDYKEVRINHVRTVKNKTELISQLSSDLQSTQSSFVTKLN